MAKNFPKLPKEDLEKIIQTDDGTELLVTYAEKIGEALADRDAPLSTSQIRAIFGEVRRIEGDWQVDKVRANRSLILLKPKMAYRAKKEEKKYNKSVGNLTEVLRDSIDLVNANDKNFTRFVDFFEAILAYHKAHGGN
ncbi:MAG: type III-A CRISPR-associated protein Csm2 [Anaerolineae bacterium]|nr:type III-A CRISPR-associated protein Csm2 [Anaerolineae bacterium]